MYRIIALTTAALALSTSALAGEAEITLKYAADMATALAVADPAGDWVAVDASDEPRAAKAKADILIESLRDGSLAFGYDRGLLRDVPYGSTSDRAFQIYAVDTIDVERGAENGTFTPLPTREAATIAAPRDLTWTQVASDHLGYLLVSSADGTASLVLPVATALTGIEPDEID